MKCTAKGSNLKFIKQLKFVHFFVHIFTIHAFLLGNTQNAAKRPKLGPNFSEALISI